MHASDWSTTPVAIGARAHPECAARGANGRVSLTGGGRESCFFVGGVALRGGQLRLADLAIFHGVVERLQIFLRNSNDCRRRGIPLRWWRTSLCACASLRRGICLRVGRGLRRGVSCLIDRRLRRATSLLRYGGSLPVFQIFIRGCLLRGTLLLGGSRRRPELAFGLFVLPR